MMLSSTKKAVQKWSLLQELENTRNTVQSTPAHAGRFGWSLILALWSPWSSASAKPQIFHLWFGEGLGRCGSTVSSPGHSFSCWGRTRAQSSKILGLKSCFSVKFLTVFCFLLGTFAGWSLLRHNQDCNLACATQAPTPGTGDDFKAGAKHPRSMALVPWDNQQWWDQMRSFPSPTWVPAVPAVTGT